MLSMLSSPKDWIACCITTNLYCLLTGAAVARNNFGGPRVNNIKGHFNRIAVAYPHFVCSYRYVS